MKDVMQVVDANNGGALPQLKNLALIVYCLQAVGIFVGLTWLIAVVINYVKLSDVKGTWLESHFKWQIKTFWISLLILIIGVITAAFIIGYVILFANVVFVIYKITKGVLLLLENKPTNGSLKF